MGWGPEMGFLDNLRFALGTIAVAMLAMLAIVVGAFVALGLAVAAAAGALLLRHRLKQGLRRPDRPVVIEGEYYEIRHR